MSMSSSVSSKILNLRYKPVSEELLNSPAHKDVEKLWIGPAHDMTPFLVVQSLPSSLEHLDWDMTDSSTIQGEVLQDLFQIKSLKHLCLRFRGDTAATELAKHLPSASFLESLDLRGNHIGDIGAQALANALQDSTIVHVNLGYNRIGDKGLVALSQAVKLDSCALQGLNLSCNVFGQEGTNHLALALKTNQSLQELSLFCNAIPHASCVELASCLEKHNFTLQHLKLGGTLTDTFSDIRMKIDFLLKLNRHGRIQLREHQSSRREWTNILSNAASDVDMLLYFLSNKPELLLCSSQ